MTRDRDAKRSIRARMRVTGERYTQARDALFGPSADAPPARPGLDRQGGAMVDQQLLESLDRDGYAVVRDVVPPAVVEDLRVWVERLVEEDLDWRMQEAERRRDAGESDVRAFARGSEGQFHLPLDAGVGERLAAGVAAIVAAVGTSIRGGGGIAACLPGWGGHSGLHQDLGGPAPAAGEWDAAVVHWPLTPAWEGMRVVPGSHRRDPVFPATFAGAVAPHPDEVYVEAGPGDVVVNSVHVWKSGLLNRSNALSSGIWIGFVRDDSVPSTIEEYWANADVRDGDAPYDPGNVVERDQATP